MKYQQFAPSAPSRWSLTRAIRCPHGALMEPSWIPIGTQVVVQTAQVLLGGTPESSRLGGMRGTFEPDELGTERDVRAHLLMEDKLL